MTKHDSGETPGVAAVVVSPGEALLTGTGAIRALTASVQDANGNPVEEDVIWSSDDEAVATVTQNGVVTAVSTGVARVTARAGGVSGHADLDVTESSHQPILLASGRVITMDPVDRIEESILILDDRIYRTGSYEKMRELVGDAAVEVDLGERSVMPGFVDPHNHAYNAVFLGESQNRVGTTYAEAQRRLIATGITTVANANVWPDALTDFKNFVDAGELRMRTSIYLGYNDVCGNKWPEDWYLNHPPVTDPGARFRIPGIKIFSDGGVCNEAAVSFLADGGDLYTGSADLAATIDELQGYGYQVAIHALGDIAVDTVLAALDIALAGNQNTFRHRIEHNRFVRPDQLPLYGETDPVVTVFGSPFTCLIQNGTAFDFLNDPGNSHLREWLDPARALMETNPELVVAWKSDVPIWPLNPFIHLWSLVTRDELSGGMVCEAPPWLEAGAVSLEQALRMMTVNAAHALGMAEFTGSLAAGKFADLIVLSDNPLSVPLEEIREIDVLMTMIGGKVEFCESGYEAICPEI